MLHRSTKTMQKLNKYHKILCKLNNKSISLLILPIIFKYIIFWVTVIPPKSPCAIGMHINSYLKCITDFIHLNWHFSLKIWCTSLLEKFQLVLQYLTLQSRNCFLVKDNIGICKSCFIFCCCFLALLLPCCFLRIALLLMVHYFFLPFPLLPMSIPSNQDI